MGVRQDLLDLFVRGGLEIVTPADGEPAGEGHLSIRTLVMPDADIITWVQPGVMDEAMWTQHQERLRQKISSIHILRWSLKWGGFIIMTGLFVLFNLWVQQLIPFLISLLVSFVMGYLIRLGFSAALRLYIQRQNDKYLGPLVNS